jgi:zinc and cadmium transporter
LPQASAAFPEAIIAYYALEVMHFVTPYVMAISAASFLYIALADLSPELHRKVGVKHAITPFLLLVTEADTIVLRFQFHPWRWIE